MRDLPPCPSSPNCVSSQAASAGRQIEPLRFEESPEAAQERARRALGGLPRCRIVEDEPGYLHAEATSALFRFVDDVELAVDADAGVIHLRSASRIGRWDMGANRRRMLGRLFASAG